MMVTRLSHELGICLRSNVCLCLVLVALVVLTSAHDSLDSTQGSHELDIELFRDLWNAYILPKLEMDLNKRLDSLQSDSDLSESYGYLADHQIDQMNANRQKRKNFMGMDNMDKMFASLNSKPRFMSMDSSFGNLQNLLRKAGRKRR
ncbi:hypothetical protein MAR_008855 [Mya arenaria]|uniref:Uncharacterized protein n=1 Tax=Mya arenaria TaxID=6604 RepID=A0ABY7DZU2_MYAAR|nr:uncharacterized protein LOC128232828 [Mya arenaria]XP_052802544.1 uncharacterized protein LOC128232828 [Mya arenaria]WAR02297.1 hypothetical protein MAR_008855 [Mya arenaria]